MYPGIAPTETGPPIRTADGDRQTSLCPKSCATAPPNHSSSHATTSSCLTKCKVSGSPTSSIPQAFATVQVCV
jgi:hypothetical protein